MKQSRRLARRRRRKAPPRRTHDLRHLYGTLIAGRTVAVAIEEPGGLLSTDSARLEAAVRRDGTLAEGAPEWVPPSRPTVIVAQSIHRDPLGQMWAREQIDHASYFAGRGYQELHALAEIGGVGAMDPSKPFVQGGKIPEVLTDRQQRAVKRIRGLDNKLFSAFGREGLWLTRLVLVDRITLAQASRYRGENPKTTAVFLGALFRRCLTQLAVDLGFATPPPPVSAADRRGKVRTKRRKALTHARA